MHQGQTKGALLALFDPAPMYEEEFNDWYDLEHIPERLPIPGFGTTRRWVAVSEGPRYLTTYELADLGVLKSPEYLRISGTRYTPWSQRMMRKARIFRRMVSDLVPGATAGETGGDALLLSLWRVAPAAGEAFAHWLTAEMVPSATACPGVTAVRAYTTIGDENSNHAVVIYFDEWRSGASPAWDTVLAAAGVEQAQESDRLLYRPYVRAE